MLMSADGSSCLGPVQKADKGCEEGKRLGGGVGHIRPPICMPHAMPMPWLCLERRHACLQGAKRRDLRQAGTGSQTTCMRVLVQDESGARAQKLVKWNAFQSECKSG